MRNRYLQKTFLYLCMIILALCCLAGCAKSQEEDIVTEDTQTEEAEDSLYLIMKNDVLEETLTLYSYETGLEHYYAYDFSTQFKNKYGDYIPSVEFVAGRIIEIGDRNSEGCLKEVQLTDQVWEYEGVRRFSIDKESGIFTIADTKYSILDRYFMFSNGDRINSSQISEDDILTVIGKDKKILSVIVTTGHGTLSLNNTEDFEGSFIQLNSDIFAIITQNMDMEVPEGTYTLKVANNGWGGTTEIEIVRGETTEIDLEELKGEGKKTGIVTFDISVEDVSVYVDRELIDHTQGIELTYGVHQIAIEAPGYNTWKKYLSVNSPNSTIVIDLEDDEDADSEDENTEDESQKSEGVEEDSESDETENETSTEMTETETQTTENEE